MDWATYILFSVAGNPVTLVEMLSVAFGFSCVILAASEKVANFWVGYFYNIFLFILFLHTRLYFSAALQPISFVIAAVGHYRWTHPSAERANRKNRLKISTLSLSERVIVPLIVLCAAAILGWAMRGAGARWPESFPPAQYPYIDAFVTVLFLVSAYLSANKKIECWVAWITADIIQIVLYLLSGLVFMPLVCFGYTTISAIGLASWRHKMKNQ